MQTMKFHHNSGEDALIAVSYGDDNQSQQTYTVFPLGPKYEI